jgi:hypothetical protein
LRAKGCRAILAAAIGSTALVLGTPARAEHVLVVTTSDFAPAGFADRGAVGLLVPGRGPTVTRAELFELLRLNELPSPRCANRRPCPIEIFVEEPPREETHNVTRYTVAVVGGGYRGLLVSDNTRLAGLVSPADVADTVEALERGEEPPLESREDADAPQTLAELDRRLADAHDARTPANVVLVAALLALSALALALRSRLLGRAAVLAAPAALSAALLLSALETTSTLLLAALTLALALGGGALGSTRLRLGALLVLFLAAYGVVLVLWPEVNSLALIGPHPDGGGRFYGITNQVATLLLVPSLLAGALLAPAGLIPVAVLALALSAWSRAGADGGGALVLATGLLVLGFRLRGLALTPRRLAVVAAGAVAVGLAVVALDALGGGTSHVTRAVGSGPLDLVGELGHRLRVSFEGATSSWYAALMVVGGVAALGWLLLRGPGSPVVDAAVIALAVSLLVNDTPTDVAFFGALSCGALAAWIHVRRHAPVSSV